MEALCSQIEMYMQSFGSRLGTANLHHIGDSLMRIDRNESQLHFISCDSGEVEQVINQLRFQFDIATDHGQSRLAVFRLHRLGLKRFQSGNDWSQWRPEFVRKHG